MSSPATGPMATYPGINSSSPAPASKSPAPGPAPSPAPAANPLWNPAGLPLWALTLIFAIVLILIVAGFGRMMTMNKPINLK